MKQSPAVGSETQQRLRDSEGTKAAIFAAAGESTILIDANGLVLDVNEVAATRLGQTVETLLGKSIFDFMPPETRESRQALHKEMIESVRGPMTTVDCRDGSWFETNAYPIMDDDDQVQQIVLIARDVTQHKHTEEALRVTQTELEARVADLARSNAQLEATQKSMHAMVNNIAQGLVVFE